MRLLHNVVSTGIDIINASVLHIKRCVLRVSSSDENLLHYMSDKLDRASIRKEWYPHRNLNEWTFSLNQFCLQKVNVEKQKAFVKLFAQLLKKNLFRNPGVRLHGRVL